MALLREDCGGSWPPQLLEKAPLPLPPDVPDCLFQGRPQIDRNPVRVEQRGIDVDEKDYIAAHHLFTSVISMSQEYLPLTYETASRVPIDSMRPNVSKRLATASEVRGHGLELAVRYVVDPRSLAVFHTRPRVSVMAEEYEGGK